MTQVVRFEGATSASEDVMSNALVLACSPTRLDAIQGALSGADGSTLIASRREDKTVLVLVQGEEHDLTQLALEVVAALLLLVVGIIQAIVNIIRGKAGSDMADLMRRVVVAFASVVSEVLKQERLNQTMDLLRALQRQLEAYAAAPDLQTEALTPLSHTAENLYALAEGLELQGVAALMIAAPLRASIYFEIARVTEDDRLLTVYRDRCVALNALVPVLTDQLRRRVTERFSSVSHHSKPVGKYEYEEHWWSYRRDNVWQGKFDTEEAAAEHRARQVEGIFGDSFRRIIVPLDAVASQLVIASDRTLQP